MNWIRWNAPAMVPARVRIDERLGQPGHALEQHVAVGQQPDQQPLEHGVLAHDDPAELGHELADQPAFPAR